MTFSTNFIINSNYNQLFEDIRENFAKKIFETFTLFIEFFLCTNCCIYTFNFTKLNELEAASLLDEQKLDQLLNFTSYLTTYINYERFNNSGNNYDVFTRIPVLMEFTEYTNKVLKLRLHESIASQIELIKSFYHGFVDQKELINSNIGKLLGVNLYFSISKDEKIGFVSLSFEYV